MELVKKTFDYSVNSSISVDYAEVFLNDFSSYFLAHRFDNTSTARNYFLGLLKCPKGQGNMERMEEEIEQSEYRAYQHFISNSNWDSAGLQKAVALNASELLGAQKKLNGKPTGYIVDESAHIKKGTESVGVGRQYAGVIGKVDNCQVGVYASLVNKTSATIINERIFLTKGWTDDTARCKKASVPELEVQFKTKPELALDMIKQDIKRGVRFDWVGGDGLYGHNTELCRGLEQVSQFYVLDVHKDELVYLEKPKLSIPERKSSKGRLPTKLKADKTPIRLDKLLCQIKPEQWKLESIRDTTKGRLKLYVYKIAVWNWDGKEEQAIQRTLIITKTAGKKPKIKFSISNGKHDQYSHKEYAYMIAQRYWVERTFDNAKNELAMSDYQVRKWKGWHNHHTLVMLASLFIMKQQIDNYSEVPLLSFRDARILIILQVFETDKEAKIKLEQMLIRHKKRKYDIEWNYRKQSNNQSVLT